MNKQQLLYRVKTLVQYWNKRLGTDLAYAHLFREERIGNPLRSLISEDREALMEGLEYLEEEQLERLLSLLETDKV